MVFYCKEFDLRLGQAELATVLQKALCPEETRVALEAWLPKDEWSSINPLLVHFSQFSFLTSESEIWAR
jgi:hypothetical protein